MTDTNNVYNPKHTHSGPLLFLLLPFTTELSTYTKCSRAYKGLQGSSTAWNASQCTLVFCWPRQYRFFLTLHSFSSRRHEVDSDSDDTVSLPELEPDTDVDSNIGPDPVAVARAVLEEMGETDETSEQTRSANVSYTPSPPAQKRRVTTFDKLPRTNVTMNHTALWMHMKDSDINAAFEVRVGRKVFRMWRDGDDIAMEHGAGSIILDFEEWYTNHIIQDRNVTPADVDVIDEITKEKTTLANVFDYGLKKKVRLEEDVNYSPPVDTTSTSSDSFENIVVKEKNPVNFFGTSRSDSDGNSEVFVDITLEQKHALRRVMNCKMQMYGEWKTNSEFCNFKWECDGKTTIGIIAFQPYNHMWHLSFSHEQTNKSHYIVNIALMCLIAVRPCVVLVGDWCNGTNDVNSKLQKFVEKSNLMEMDRVRFQYMDGEKSSWNKLWKSPDTITSFRLGRVCLVLPCKYATPLSHLNAFLEKFDIRNVSVNIDEADTLAEHPLDAMDNDLMMEANKLLSSWTLCDPEQDYTDSIGTTQSTNKLRVTSVNFISATLLPTIRWLHAIDPLMRVHGHMVDMVKLKNNGFSIGECMKLEYELDDKAMGASNGYGWGTVPVKKFFSQFSSDAKDPEKQGCLMLYNTSPFVQEKNGKSLKSQAKGMFKDNRCNDNTIGIVVSSWGVEVTTKTLQALAIEDDDSTGGFVKPEAWSESYLCEVLAC